MNPALYLVIFLPIFIATIENQKKQQIISNNITNRKTKKEKQQMKTYIEKLIGKDCYIHTLNASIKGCVNSVNDNAIILETKKTTEIINLDFVLRVTEIKN